MDDDVTAPDGQIYVCAACGKTCKRAWGFSDVSCCMNAVLCYEKTPEADWQAVPKEPSSGR